MADERRVDCSAIVVDQSSAYKFTPIRPGNIKYATLSLWGPNYKLYKAFIPITQLFGSSSSVGSYIFSRILTSLLNRILALPVIGYFVDFALLIPSSLCDLAPASTHNFCDVLGVALKTEKLKSGHKAPFLSLQAFSPGFCNNFSLSISLTAEKASKWSSGPPSIFERRRLPTHFLNLLAVCWDLPNRKLSLNSQDARYSRYT